MFSGQRKYARPETEPTIEEPSSVDDAIARVVRKELRSMNLVQRLCVNAEETAEMLGCSPGTIDNLIEAGQLTPLGIDSRKRFDIEEVKALVKKRKKLN